ncbi:YheC/YheD family endospore coat-associated protein [Paenibacillus xylaniclasticus]|uniref:YheC/YheD family endospore coat-associated protein n=1 Tax=Paenibacillus xylaniclasticus TaxID=588083 RepID=UPI000FDB1E9D|nr:MULTISPECIES: YheC/YheD family protein [Paenibacillus]GFN30882.1 endospore coat-associated protein YheD [Paenibacillus curdlanolyticus]
MSLTLCNVQFSQQSDRVVYLSNPVLKSLNLAGKKTVHIKLGNEIIKAAVRPLKRSGHHVYLSAGVRQSIRVPKTGSVYLLQDGNNELQLGPLVGVLCDSTYRTETNPFGSNTGFIRQLLRAGEKKAYFFAFAPRDVNWQQETINGYFLNANGSWVRRVVPLPDVVYNRLPNRRAETSAEIAAFRERFTKRKIPYFNWTFFNKSDIYRILDNDVEALKHLPDSVSRPSAEKIKEMLEKHGFLYFKPTGGSFGVGIYRLTYQPKRGYFARFRRGGRNVLLRFSNFNSLMRMLQARHGITLSNYVSQQGIRLIEIDGCPIDFRFHMHKNGKNEWVTAGIGAKKAGRGSVTTHIKNGGSLMTPEQALNRVFGDKANEILEKAKQVSIKMCEAIERNYPHRLGELGLDIGIDKDGEVWMFEANAKPGRSIFKHPALREQGRASLSYILDHCLYLSRFQGGKADGTA